MVWQSYEYQSVALLDEPLVEQLVDYLESKESQLSRKIIETLRLLEGIPSLSEPEASPTLRLNEAIEEFSRKISKAKQSKTMTLVNDQWRLISNQINESLWSYVEVLEGSVKELFQQIDQIGFEYWNVDVMRTATAIKDELTHRMDDVIWGIRRLNQQLKTCRQLGKSRAGNWIAWCKIFAKTDCLLDPSLEKTVRRCNKYLNFRYGKFIERYSGYVQLYENAHQSIQKFYNFRVLSSMELDQQDKLKHLYLLLMLWKQNANSRILPESDTTRAIRSCASYDVVLGLFKDYLSSIRKALFDKSRMIKKQYRLLFIDKNVRQPLIDTVAGYREELVMLNEVASKFRKFHEMTDPPKRNWFQRLLLSPSTQHEAKHLKELQRLIHHIKTLDILALNFQASLECESAMDRMITPSLRAEVSRYLHEMGQPLASMELMQRDAKLLVSALHGLDEMGSFDPDVVNFTRRTLIRAICTDLKYQVLQSIPLFHHVYDVHQNISAEDEDRVHNNRLHKFQCILEQLKLWIENNETLRRSHEIELDINDVKAYFQDFLAHIQRVEKPTEGLAEDELNGHPITKASQAMLQYLYLFGKFFHGLHADNPEHRLIRKQFLFVDQYFEEIKERLL